MIHLKKLSDEIKPTGIADDSRKVKKGYIFVAIKGDHVDGNKYIGDAIENGAIAIVSENKPEKEWLEKVRYQKVLNARKALAFLASEFYGNPSKKLKVIGVTGSDGKTTTSHLIYEILKTAGKKVGLISSIEAKIGDNDLDTGFHVTNPEPLELHKFLSEMVKAGLEYVVLETTSHGLAQHRVYGINYEVAVLTNITHEHLDYHKTFEKYRDTKLKLFLKAKTSVLNKDDESFEYFDEKIKGKKISYSLYQPSDFKAVQVKIDDSAMLYVIENRGQTYKILTRLMGEYNIYNSLAAVAVAIEIDIAWQEIITTLRSVKSPRGRLEEVKTKTGLNIYIDFAHTPNSLKEVLTLLKSISKGKVIVVFGTASERDEAKRPIMGKIATDIADVSIFTAEDPRHEDINKILNEIESGITNKKATYHKIPERGEAISYAINEVAQKGDTVVICGKAHERSMAYNGVEYPWSDFEAVEMALKGETMEIKRKK